MNPLLKKIIFIAGGFFALIGVLFTTVFVGMQFGLFNVHGSIAERNKFFTDALATAGAVSHSTSTNPLSASSTPPKPLCQHNEQTVCDWNETSEWAVIRAGLLKDDTVIARVSQETGVSKRMIVSVVIPEQLRFFTSNREVFKRYFEPLKILGSLVQFSLGVSGIKEDTARTIENYAKNPESPFYPGPGMTELLHYPENANHDAILYSRLADAKNHYYAYLYTAIFIKEIEAQWQKSGFNISEDPGTIATIFNNGYRTSHPKADPVAGGSEIFLGGGTYSYGELAMIFYNSSELIENFPR